MRLSCLQNNLSRALSTAKKVLSEHSITPNSQYVLIEAKMGRLFFTTVNSDMTLVTSLEAVVEREGYAVVNASLLSDYISSLPNDRVDIETTDKPQGMIIKCKRSTASLRGLDIKQFPKVNVGVSLMDTVTFDSMQFRKALDKMAISALQDTSRPILNGVNVQFDGSMVWLASADGFRLSVHTLLANDCNTKIHDINIPLRAINLIKALIDVESPELTLMVSVPEIVFYSGNIMLRAVNQKGIYPDYRTLVPKAFTSKAVVNAQELLRATKLVYAVAKDASGIVRYRFNKGLPDTVTLSAKSEDLGDHLGIVDCQIEGAESKIAVNGKYMIEILSTFGNGDITLQFGTPINPMLIEEKENTSFQHVIMPMFVQWEN